MHPRLIPAALTVPVVILLSACQGMPTSSNAELDDPLAQAPPVSHGLDAAGLSTLLTAELAGLRGDYQQASRGYLEMAERYQSLALIERATLAARFANDPQLLEQSAHRWQTLAPDAEAPTRLLASLALQRGDWLASLEQRLMLTERGAHGELVDFAEQAIDQGADVAPLLSRLRQHLARDGAESHPYYYDAILATALFEAADGQLARAESRLTDLARSHPELPALWLARTRIALERGDIPAARDAARQGLEVSPDDGRFILLVAQTELMLGNVEAAEAQSDTLLEHHGDNHDLRLALARLYLDEGHPAPARRLLLPLVSADDTPPMAFTLLGTIAEEQGEVDNALLYYRQVPPGEHFLPSRLRAAQMLIDDDRLRDARRFLRIERLRHSDQASALTSLEVELLDQEGHSDEADALLQRELERNPDDLELRYVRAMRSFEAGDLEGMERDLRYIIERDPEHAMALNALGYTLADMTDRHDEAQDLIERAHRLAPNNAAILDSLGWVYHKQGDNERALSYLERAYHIMPDQEIAAHVAEVLWELGRKEEARDLIAESLERHGERPVVDALLKRIPALAP
ncbi:tetratricopeptide repeat protein [Litchfieldella rifensis]|uniref:Tetratricopeptide repeat protein n=1 Tax=Litchfieldella rifensis TaxID=762643 RepID=A0ABV7LMV3_9GAMM